MTIKHPMTLNIPPLQYERMRRTMKRERMTNKTAFVLTAIDALCEEQERESNIEQLQKSVVILTENAQRDRERAEQRHMEILLYLKAIGAKLCETDEEVEEFEADIANAKRKVRGATA